MRTYSHISVPLIILVFVVLACSLPGNVTTSQPASVGNSTIVSNQPEVLGDASVTSTPQVTTTPTLAVVHTITPPTVVDSGKPVFDVESSGTAAEKRAPYGDSYDINRLERPFLQDMTYVPDLDIETFSLGNDKDFYYVSIDLIGLDPNNAIGIQYGVELDVNADGFGDFIVLAHPPYSMEWSTTNVQVYADSNHNTAGLSGDKSDAPITTDGYDKLIFDGAAGSNSDPDLAWVRINASQGADVQFGFKKTWAGSSFMYDVIADAGLKDAGKLDYVDRFREAEAGSPVKDKKYYPLGALFAVDNTCREVFGFKPNGYEPMLCPRDQPNPTKKATNVPIPTPVPPIP